MTLRIDVLTIFPDMVLNYATESVLGRARERGTYELHVHDVREAATNPHHSVDDAPFGGGAGMVMKLEPIVATVRQNPDLARPLIALGPSGRPFNQDEARRLSTLDGFSLLCGRYEGIDQRAIDLVVDDELSLGDFVLAGGELAALCIIESVVRLLPGSLGNDESVTEESFESGLLEYPQFTRPADFEGHAVPDVLLSGDHARIKRWRLAQALRRTMERRDDLIQRRGGLSEHEVAVLREFGDTGTSQSLG